MQNPVGLDLQANISTSLSCVFIKSHRGFLSIPAMTPFANKMGILLVEGCGLCGTSVDSRCYRTNQENVTEVLKLP